MVSKVCQIGDLEWQRKFVSRCLIYHFINWPYILCHNKQFSVRNLYFQILTCDKREIFIQVCSRWIPIQRGQLEVDDFDWRSKRCHSVTAHETDARAWADDNNLLWQLRIYIASERSWESSPPINKSHLSYTVVKTYHIFFTYLFSITRCPALSCFSVNTKLGVSKPDTLSSPW